MGLFGKAAKGLFSGDVMSKFARAQALANDDYLGAARISSAMQESELERRKAEAGAQQAQAIRDGLRARGYNDGDIAVIMANPDNASALMKEILQPRQFGPGGGTVGSVDPGTGQTSYNWAPRADEDGNFYGAGDASKAPPLLREGFKTVPVAPGGSVAVIGAASGIERGVSAAPKIGPQPGEVVDGYQFMGGNPNDPNAWKPVGGAGQVGPRTFR